MTIRKSTLASLAAAFVGIQVGSAIVATRFVIHQTQPASLAFLRYGIGVICLLPLLMASTRTPFAKRDLLPLSLLGIVQFGIVVALLNYALQFIPSARAALIFATLPLQAMIIAALMKQERLTITKIIGVVLTIIGIGFVFGEQIFIEEDDRRWIGDVSVFITAFSAAACSILYRPYLQGYPTLQVSIFAMFASVVFLAFLAAGEGFFNQAPNITLTGWFAILFIGCGSALGYYLWLWALNHSSPTKVTIFLSLNPITAAGFGAFFLGETITIPLLIGVICVILGIGIAHVNNA